MKRNIIYIVIAAIVGLGVGYFLFGESNTETMEMTEHNHSPENGQMWTCSMHPQIMQPEAGDCPICGMDLIPADAGADGLSPEQFKMTANAMALANIRTTVVGDTEGDNDNTISLSGKIAVNEEAMAVQASYFDGRIERLNVNYEGQAIRKGQLLATIYSPELVAAQQELLTAASLRESQPQLYSAVRNKLKLWKLSDNQINSIESSSKVKENFPVYATVSGTVSEVMSSEGDYLKKGQPIVKVSNLNTVWAEFDVYESQLSQFKKGQKISIAANAYPNKTFDGEVTFIDPVLDNTTRTVTIRATLSNQKDMFKPGMFVSGKIESGLVTPQASLLVPSSAIMWTGERSLVYVKANGDEPIFEMREVMLGARSGDQIEVANGLDYGEEIVTNGTFTVDAAAQLQGKKSMMNKTGGKTMTGHEGHMGMLENNSSSDISGEMMKIKFSDGFQKDFEAALPAYLKLKDALVSGDAPKTSMDAIATLEILKKLDLSDTGAMEKAHVNKSIEMLEAIAKKEDLENQRIHFVILNENIVAIASNLDSLDNTLYVQKCPMANNNRGAVWLSTENEIRNPYFGDAMLTCGSVVKILK
ncbi:efflux RND transporter periplasmic adaptor subunit [Flagellimonas aquimarina]|uniref:Efflux RND transporter periplasmic adaptor subunit n=1 Tax=Flagellimonas aquimarina TaxID=2201895 RepID=A0A316L0C2_9FLAO|nr:efflux RND transporter periplasmic adaptor subunit [Allomuricauda koreensis]PWL38399.1 efflux RND transporter periplasmic adaptor subunit [Allomuricauda koreensis]